MICPWDSRVSEWVLMVLKSVSVSGNGIDLPSLPDAEVWNDIRVPSDWVFHS